MIKKAEFGDDGGKGSGVGDYVKRVPKPVKIVVGVIVALLVIAWMIGGI